MEILALKNLTFYYPESEHPAIHELSLSVEEGDFFVLCGHSGCGKSTLLRQWKPCLTPHGERSGDILFRGEDIANLSERDAASKIGFVEQSVENQIVTDKVWHELAFGLESLGLDTPAIRRRVAETASFFGIQNWFYKRTSELSGGQKQLLNLASVMVMQPQVLILDEPTSQLDPVAASEFMMTLKKINSELGITVILTDHRAKEALQMANRAAVMEKGKLLCSGKIDEIGKYLKARSHFAYFSMPDAMQIWGSVNCNTPCPITVAQGRAFLIEYTNDHPIKALPQETFKPPQGKIKAELNDVWFRYEKEEDDVLKGTRLFAREGELFCILGGNGTGKSTALRLISGYIKPYRGKVQTTGKLSLLPQDPQTLFLKKTVRENLTECIRYKKLSKKEACESLDRVISLCRLSELEDRHPYDLSGGEQQRAALAMVLLTEPEILLLDEPTKGMDDNFKFEFAEILKKLCKAGVCIVMVSHDIEFCANYADRCALFFDGSIICEGSAHEFFSGNSYYTTQSSRIAKNVIPEAVTVREVIKAIGGKIDEMKKSVPEVEYTVKKTKPQDPAQTSKKLPLWRRIASAVCAIAALGVMLYAVKNENLSAMIDREGITSLGKDQFALYALIIIFLFLCALFISRRSSPPLYRQIPEDRQKLSKSSKVSLVSILLLMPVTLFVGAVYIDGKQYYLTALALLLEAMLLFFTAFEGKRPKARELVIIATLCALAIAGRAAFFMLPQFKPVLALTVIAGVAFGGEAGFLVGSLTMLVSNIMFSQGPWTPWQMFAMGIVGFLAGVLYKKGMLRRSRLGLALFGATCAILVYGVIMNFAFALMWNSASLSPDMLLGYYITGFPMDCVHAAASALFLHFLSEPMLEKLDRIKIKYGLIK